MARLELAEREISITQSAQDRRDGVWHIWSNDPYWQRRLAKIGAEVVREDESSKTYRLQQRQVLVRKVPAPRQGPRKIEFLQRKAHRGEREATHIRAEVGIEE